MYSLPLPADDWSLLLVPRFAGLGWPGQPLALAVLGLVPAVLVVWLYRHELRLVRAAAAATLLLTRLLAVAGLWLLVALQPTLARTDVEDVPSRVLVALDRSASMAVSDPQRPTADRLRLARALGLLPAGVTDTQVERWLEPERQKDANEEALYREALDAVAKLGRDEVGRRLLSADGADLLARLADRHRVEVLAFGATASPLTGGPLPDGPPAEAATDLQLPLRRAIERSGGSEGQILGVLLLSDGRHNAGEPPVALAAELGQRQVPVFPVAVAGPGSPPDLAVVSVNAPAHAFKDTESTVAARVRVTGVPAQDVTVELTADGRPAEEQQKKVLKHDGTDRTFAVTFPFRSAESGPRQLEVRVRPGRAETVETTPDNNARRAVVRVAEDRARVLLVESEARWEFHYLLTALRRDPSVKPEAVVFRQPRLGQIKADELEKSDHPKSQLPRPAEGDGTGDPLWGYECVVLGDVAPDDLPMKDRQRLERYVAEQGGTLVLSAGKRWLPLRYAVAGTDIDPLAKLLPVDGPRAVAPKDGFPVTLTADGTAAPYLHLDPTPEGNATRWAELPRVFWGAVGKAKPGATVLASVRGEHLEGKADGVGERDNALIATHNYGLGRVVYVGLDGTWRWRYRTGDEYHHRFWGQLVRWAASERLLPAGDDFARYGSRKPAYDQGEAVDVTLRLGDRAPALPANTSVKARVLRVTDGKEEAAAEVTLAPGPAARTFQAAVRDLAPGAYRVEPLVLGWEEFRRKGGTKDTPDGRDGFVVAPAESEEQRQPAGNRELLEDLAAASGGEVLEPWEVRELVERLAARTVRHERREEQRPWRDPPLTWWVFGIFLTLLTAEWVVRKAAGLP